LTNGRRVMLSWRPFKYSSGCFIGKEKEAEAGKDPGTCPR